jgi:hypothetical protein
MPQVFRFARESPQRPVMLIFISPQTNRAVGLLTVAWSRASDASDAYTTDVCCRAWCTMKCHTSSHFKEPTIDFVNTRRIWCCESARPTMQQTQSRVGRKHLNSQQTRPLVWQQTHSRIRCSTLLCRLCSQLMPMPTDADITCPTFHRQHVRCTATSASQARIRHQTLGQRPMLPNATYFLENASLPLKFHRLRKCANTTKCTSPCACVLAFSQSFYKVLR